MNEINHCLNCGACCAFYRASFYWAEGNDATPQGVPVELTDRLDDFRRVMKGTNSNKPRCQALAGIIGARVHCQIYECRASVCRDFAPAWLNGVPNERCAEARTAWGLLPLEPDSWNFPCLPKAA